MSVAGANGTNKGPASDGVLVGQLTPANPTAVEVKNVAAGGLCMTDDGGVYVNETTPFNEATDDDVEVLPATPALNDAAYFGHATGKFARLDLDISTAGDGVWTIAWEYWNGAAWVAVSGLSDGTTAFKTAADWVTVSFTLPTDWEKNTVNNVLGYWVRARVSAYTSVTTAPQVARGWIVTSTATWENKLVDFTDAGVGDVDLLPTYPLVGDGIYVGYGEKFCKLKVTTSQARTGTATLTPKYWNGSTWVALTTYDDDSVGWSATAGTHFIHFIPPSDWIANTAANGPNGKAGYFISMELTAMTSVTAKPLATQGWVYPLKTGASGMSVPASGDTLTVSMNAQTASGSNKDSTYLLVNTTKGTSAAFVWAKTDPTYEQTVTLPFARGDDVALVQITEDGTTEFADTYFQVLIV